MGGREVYTEGMNMVENVEGLYSWYKDPVVRNLLRLAVNLRIGAGLDVVEEILDKTVSEQARVKQGTSPNKLRFEREMTTLNDHDSRNQAKTPISEAFHFEGLVGQTAQISLVYEIIQKMAATDTNVLITGESGTGKELFARAIHRKSSRRDKPFIVVRLGALTDTLVETELFGHERGAFTGASQRKIGAFELADGGTLVLDEVGEIGLETQAKLLRALETTAITRLGGSNEIKVDVRVIATSNRDLYKLIEAKSFREDLFYRLIVISLDIPPLRERKEDIPLFLDYFLKRHARYSNTVKSFSPEAIACLTEYPWPGNIRELENVVEHAVVVSLGEVIGVEDIPPHIRYAYQTEKVLRGSSSLSMAVADLERELILEVLRKTAFNRSKAASLLRTSMKDLDDAIERLKIRRREITQ